MLLGGGINYEWMLCRFFRVLLRRQSKDDSGQVITARVPKKVKVEVNQVWVDVGANRYVASAPLNCSADEN